MIGLGVVDLRLSRFSVVSLVPPPSLLLLLLPQQVFLRVGVCGAGGGWGVWVVKFVGWFGRLNVFQVFFMGVLLPY